MDDNEPEEILDLTRGILEIVCSKKASNNFYKCILEVEDKTRKPILPGFISLEDIADYDEVDDIYISGKVNVDSMDINPNGFYISFKEPKECTYVRKGVLTESFFLRCEE